MKILLDLINVSRRHKKKLYGLLNPIFYIFSKNLGQKPVKLFLKQVATIFLFYFYTLVGGIHLINVVILDLDS